MAKLSPLQRVRSEYGTKAKLSEKVLGFLSAPEGEEEDAFKARIGTLSNAKLLRLLDANKSVVETYGSKDELIKKIVEARFKGGNAPYATKLATFSEPRLLDLARQNKI